MLRRVAYLAVSALILATALTSCATFKYEPRQAWRAEAERACMADRPFRRDDYIEQLRPIRDHLICGLRKPLSVAAFNDGTVAVGPTATMGCPLAVAMEAWLTGAVQPSAMSRLGSPVVAIHQLSSYSCRPVNNQVGGDPSEHAFGNALDIASFELADGRVITVADDWYGGTQAERDFLREIDALACSYFTTVLGPGYPNHSDHFHVDLGHHNADGTSHYCNPEPAIPAAPRTAAAAMPVDDAPGPIGRLLGALFRQ
jgi:hypothetical protein